MKTKILLAIGLSVILALAFVAIGSAVSGAAFTTFNAHVDGSSKDVCKQTAINCNHYGAKEYVWLNGGPTANGLRPDGDYFFAVLEPGGQPNPNDGAVVPGVANGDKNLSDDYDAYTNRIFRITDGEVSAYSGDHWLDSGKNEPGPGDPKPNGLPPYIRLFPYSDTTNPGGVYIMAICSLEDGYPVDPRDCKYDAFKVRKGKLPYQFMLSGIKFEDTYADGMKDPTAIDPGLSGWTITIKGTGPDGNPIDATAITGADGYWEWFSTEYTFTGGAQPGPVHLDVCEVLPPSTLWTQSYPASGCYTLDFTPVAGSFDSFEDRDFGNWYPGKKSGMKFEDLDADGVKDAGEPGLAGWTIYVDYNGDSDLDADEPYAVTGADGKYTITGIKPGALAVPVREVLKEGWTCSYPDPCYYEEIFFSRADFTGNDFGNWYPATKGGYKWYDRNGNGTWEDGEPIIAGWKIEVYAGDTLVDSMLTDEDGYYEFSLKPGTYTVKEVCPSAKWYQSWPVPGCGCGSGVYTVTLASRQVEKNNNFGNYCEGHADFDTKGYWHNKNGLDEITQADIDYVNSLPPYSVATTYWAFPFDGDWEAGTDTYFGTGAWAEISDFLPDRVSADPARMQLLQQLLAFIFNTRHRLDDPGAAIFVGGEWVSAQSIIDEAIAAWLTPGTDDDHSWEVILDALNNNNEVPVIHYYPCEVTYP